MRKDYCGAYWMPSFLRKMVSSKFNASCRLHDIHYTVKKMTRKQSDVAFLQNMIKQADSSLWVIIAVIFYILVRIGGKISWKHEE